MKLFKLEDQITKQVCQWIGPDSEWRTAEGDLIDKKQKVDCLEVSSNGQPISWQFRHRPHRQIVSDLTIRYYIPNNTSEKRLPEYQSFLMGIAPQRMAYYTSDAGVLTDCWLIDLDAMIQQPKIIAIPDGYHSNGDGTGFAGFS